MHQYRWKQYRTGLMKARSTLDQATIRYAFENGENPACWYWTQNPHTGKCTAVCGERNNRGDCLYNICKETGERVPNDYYGNFEDCRSLYKYFKKAMNVIKVCESNAYRNGCIPNYAGSDTIYKSQNPDVTDQEAQAATSGCNNFQKDRIASGRAFVTADGMIFFPYGSENAQLMGVDINGQAGPNKWGYDVFSLQAKIRGENTVPVYSPGVCSLVEKGGVSAATLLYGKNYM